MFLSLLCGWFVCLVCYIGLVVGLFLTGGGLIWIVCSLVDCVCYCYFGCGFVFGLICDFLGLMSAWFCGCGCFRVVYIVMVRLFM